MGEPENRFARTSTKRAQFVAAGVVVAAVSAAALSFMVAGVDGVEVVATLLFAPVVVAAIVGGRKAGFVAAVVATGVYAALRFGDLEDTGSSRVALLVVARAACFGIVAYATPLLTERVPSLSGPRMTTTRQGARHAAAEWDEAPPDATFELEDVPPQQPWAGSPEPVPAASSAWAGDPYGEPADPYGEAPLAAAEADRWAPGPPLEPAAPGTGEGMWASPPESDDDAWAPAPAFDPAAAQDEPVPWPSSLGAGAPSGPTGWAEPPAPAGPGVPGGHEWLAEPASEAPAEPWMPQPAQPYAGSGAAAPSVPTGWIDDATVPLGDETIPVGFTGELFLPRELRDHPLGESTNGGNGSSNGGPHHGAGAGGYLPPNLPSQQIPPPQPGPPAPPQPGYGEAPYGEPPYDDAPYDEAPYGEPAYGEASYGEAEPAGLAASLPPRRPVDTGSHRRYSDDPGDLYGVDPETRLWNARFFRDRLTQARDESRRSGSPFSLVMVQVADEPFQTLPYRRQVALLRELGHQFVQARVLDHLVHLPDGAQHWFAVILPDTDRAGAHQTERRLRSAIGGYLRSRGLRIGEVQSASLTSPDDDEALASVWASLLGSTSV